MQIIVKENLEGKMCLYDTRSNQFFKGGCVFPESRLLEIANSIVRKSSKTIIELVDFPIYGDYGYVQTMIAHEYLKMNPDIREKFLLSKEKIRSKIDHKRTRKEKKPREKNNTINATPKKRGRPPKNKNTHSEND